MLGGAWVVMRADEWLTDGTWGYRLREPTPAELAAYQLDREVGL